MSISQETKKRFSKADISRFGFTLSELPADKTTSSSAKSNFSVTSKHNKMFFNGGIDDTLEELEDKLYAKFLEYIRKFS